jgi:SPP1 family phage portal protein
MNITEYGQDWFYDYVWATAENTTMRDRAQRRIDYFNGEHDILAEDTTYANGQAKGTRVMNWIGEVVKRHVGSITPFSVSAKHDTNTDALDEYARISEDQSLPKIDKLLLRDALLCGYAVEFQSFDGKETRIHWYRPTEWAFLWDSNGDMVAAVRVVTFAENTVHRGAVVGESTEAMWIYTAEEAGEYTRSANTKGGFIGEVKPNDLGLIPVVVWSADEDLLGIISDALLAMNDEYNAALNLQGDDIRNTVDALLKMWGLDDRWVKDNEASIRDMRTLPFNGTRAEQDAEYLSRTLDIEPHTRHLTDTRECVHVMGSIPDVLHIVGASGSTSGIALKLMFTPMQEAFDSYSQFLLDSLRARIDIWNARQRKLNRPTLDTYNADVQFRIPTNRIEEWQNIKALDGVVSHATQLRLLSDIEDPTEELQNVVNEMGEDAPSIIAARIEENEIRAAQVERQLIQQAELTTQAVASIAENLRGVITSAVRANG